MGGCWCKRKRGSAEAHFSYEQLQVRVLLGESSILNADLITLGSVLLVHTAAGAFLPSLDFEV